MLIVGYGSLQSKNGSEIRIPELKIVKSRLNKIISTNVRVFDKCLTFVESDMGLKKLVIQNQSATTIWLGPNNCITKSITTT
jgi:hypothetical protein